MSKRPLKSTDKRRTKRKAGVRETEGTSDSDGAGPPLADLFNDRRRANGHAKRAG